MDYLIDTLPSVIRTDSAIAEQAANMYEPLAYLDKPRNIYMVDCNATAPKYFGGDIQKN
jgi:hypothetical protein